MRKKSSKMKQWFKKRKKKWKAKLSSLRLLPLKRMRHNRKQPQNLNLRKSKVRRNHQRK